MAGYGLQNIGTFKAAFCLYCLAVLPDLPTRFKQVVLKLHGTVQHNT